MGKRRKTVRLASVTTFQLKLKEKWPVQSRPPVSPLEERLPGSSSPPRPPGSRLPPPEESRSPTDTGPVRWLSVRSGDTRSPLSSSSESCPSSVSSEKSPRISKLISDSSPLPLALFRRPARLTWLVCLRTPTSPGELEERGPKSSASRLIHRLVDSYFFLT